MAGIPLFKLAGAAAGSATASSAIWPTHATNDVGLLVIETANQLVTLVSAAGFAEITGSPLGTGTAAATSATRITAYWARATNASMPNVQFLDGGDHIYSRIFTVSGAAITGNPWDTVAFSVATSNTAVTVTAITTTVANCLIIAVVAHGTDSNTAQLSGWADASLADPSIGEHFDEGSNASGGGGIGAASGGLASPGSSGNITATLASSVPMAKMMIAIRPDTTITGTGSMAVAQPAYAITATLNNFQAKRQAIINGIDSAQSEANGWDAVVKAGLAVGAVVRTSDTVVTITVSAFAAYNITAQETITVTVPASALTIGAAAITATPTFTVDTAGGPAAVTGSGSAAVAIPTLAGTGKQNHSGTGTMAVSVPVMAGTGIRGGIGSGSMAVAIPTFAGTGQQQHTGTGTLAVPVPAMSGTTNAITGTGTMAVAVPSISGTGKQNHSGTGSMAVARPSIAGSGKQNHTGTGSMAVAVPGMSGTQSLFAGVRAAIIAGLDSAQAEATGWDAVVKAGQSVAGVVRTSDTVVTITLDAFPTYDITANETITVTIPASALVGGVEIVATPTFSVAFQAATGSMAVAKPSMAGTGQQSHAGTGSMAVPLPNLLFGDTIAIPVPAMSGTGFAGAAGEFVGSGELAVSPSMSGTGQQAHAATGAMAVPQPAFSGTDSTITGTGSAAVPVPAMSGTGLVIEIPIVGTLSPGGASPGRRRGPKQSFGKSEWDLAREPVEAVFEAHVETPPIDQPRVGKPKKLVPVEAQVFTPPAPVSVPSPELAAIDALLGATVEDGENDDEEALMMLLAHL